MDQQKRQTAYITTIKELIEGTYVKEEGWLPNYILTKNNIKISRANLIATIVASQENVTVDDGTGTIMLRSFEEPLTGLSSGDVLLIIGKPREYNSEKYIVPEIVKKLADPLWVKYRKLQLGKRNFPEEKTEEIVEEIIEESPSEKIIALIRKNDPGQGADFDEIVKLSNILNCEKILISLLEQGEIFEMRPGKLKVL